MLTSYITFIKSHETILALVLGSALVWGVSGKIESAIAKHDSAQEVQAQIIATAQSQKDAAIAAQVAADKSAFDALQAKMQAQDAALEQANVALATALAKQQKTDSTLPPTELVARWNTLVPSANVTVSANGESLPNSGAIATVQALEEVPALRTQNENERTQIENGQALLTASVAQVATLDTEVSGLRLEINDDKNVCKQQLKVQADAARKSKRKWFELGFITGFLARQVIKTETGF